MIYYIYNGSELLGFVYKNKTYYYHKNMFGDIIGILDSNYNEIVSYEYDSLGALVNITDNSNINLGTINPFRYRSYYYDEETKLYYLNSRYYNPEIGRFVNADGYVSTGQGINSTNMFMYCKNNFPNLKDLDGNFSLLAVIVVVGSAIILGGCSSNSKKNNQTSKPREDLKQAPDLDRKNDFRGDYNCYGNAIGKKVKAAPTGYQSGDSTRKTFEAVKKDIGGK